MKTCRFLFLLGALLGLSGCPGTPCFDGGVTAPPSIQPGVILVGKEVRLSVLPNIISHCGTAPQDVPTTLSVEISGPDNQPVAHQATLGTPSSSTATLRFTPDQPGRHHVFAAFDPVGGIHQFDLYAARDRSAEAPTHVLPQVCSSLERTQRGGWLCDTNFLRDSLLVRQFTNARVAVAGDVVWVVTGTQIQRFVDTGTELELTASLAAGSGSATDFLLASENELLALRYPNIERITFDGTALALKGTAPWPAAAGLGGIGSTNLRGLLLRSGDLLALVTNASPNNGSTVPRPGFTNQACAYRIEPDRLLRTTTPCQSFTGDVVGFETGAMWVGTPFSFGDAFADLRRLDWTASGLVEQASLPLGPHFALPKDSFGVRNSVVPVIIAPTFPLSPSSLATVAVYAPEKRAILLELLDAELPEPSASTSLLWGRPLTNSTSSHVRVRPTTP